MTVAVVNSQPLYHRRLFSLVCSIEWINGSRYVPISDEDIIVTSRREMVHFSNSSFDGSDGVAIPMLNLELNLIYWTHQNGVSSVGRIGSKVLYSP